MATAPFVFTTAKKGLMNGTIDLDTDSISVLLCMTAEDLDNESEVLDLGNLTMDEMDGANYARKALASLDVSEDNTNERAEFDANDVVWSDLGAGTNNIAGALVYKNVNSDNNNESIPIMFTNNGGFPIAANGGDLTIQWNAEGILQLT